MGSVIAFKKEPLSFKSVQCKQCGGYKFAAMQDKTTIKLQMWCVECWTIASSIELKDSNGK